MARLIKLGHRRIEGLAWLVGGRAVLQWEAHPQVC